MRLPLLDLLWNAPGASLKQRMAHGAFWSIVGAGVSQSATLAATVLCARQLGVDNYGRLGIILSTINLFASVGQLGLGLTATKHVAEFRSTDPDKAGRVIALSQSTSIASGLLVAVVLCAAARLICGRYLGAPSLTGALRLGALAMFFVAVNGSQTGILSGFEAFRQIATANFVRSVVTIPAVLAGVIWAGIDGAVGGYALVGLVSYLTFGVLIRRECRKWSIPAKHRLGMDEVRLLYHFSLPVLIAGFSFTPAVWWTNTLLAKRAGFVESGLATAAFQWQFVILFFSSAIGSLGLPMLSNLAGERNASAYRRLLYWSAVATTASAVVLAAPIALASPHIMRAYGAAFGRGSATLVLVCVATVLSAANICVGQAIWSLGAASWGMALSFLRGAALVAAAYAFIAHGAAGLASAYVLTGVVQTAAQVFFMQWLLRRKSHEWERKTAEELPQEVAVIG
jgi:O-antigen/teichoic acid export membrane protein